MEKKKLCLRKVKQPIQNHSVTKESEWNLIQFLEYNTLELDCAIVGLVKFYEGSDWGEITSDWERSGKISCKDLTGIYGHIRSEDLMSGLSVISPLCHSEL